MKKRIISFILAAIMMLGVFAFVSCKNEEHDHDHDQSSDNTDGSGNNNSANNNENTDRHDGFDYYNIAQQIVYNHDISVMPLVKVSYNELLPDTDFPKIITKDGKSIIYSYLLLSQTCRDMLNEANAEIPESVWLVVDPDKNILHGYFYDPLTESDNSSYEYFCKDVPTSSSSTREFIFYRVPQK